MSQAQISADEASSTTKQMVVVKEKQKLDRSATNAQAYENTWKCGELKLYFSPSAGG